MGADEIVASKRGEIVRLVERHGARRIRVFGSVARGDADERSVVDFLVEMEPVDLIALLVYRAMVAPAQQGRSYASTPRYWPRSASPLVQRLASGLE